MGSVALNRKEIQQLKDSMQITIDNFDLTSNGMAADPGLLGSVELADLQQ